MSKRGGRAGKLRLTGSGLPGGTQVELDGVDMAPGLTGVTLRIGVDDKPQAILDVLLWELDTELDGVQFVVPPKTREVLIQLGWTPPEGDGAS
ncbi:hypothetical protein OG592_27035 [Streptomyces avidinii]|uniref:hypothetical protein n=1 Tax=Streptomyces avidinii TaxID=1895 RepID=UPI0038701043|nr:hypothetical protein OG592_27035 [Streptomyces avidinii]